MKVVEVEGIFDFNLEKQIIKYNKGEKGVETFVPFFTHLDENGNRCGIIVNRGWVPEDFKTYKRHFKSKRQGKITGILYKGDHDQIDDIPNELIYNYGRKANAKHLSL